MLTLPEICKRKIYKFIGLTYDRIYLTFFIIKLNMYSIHSLKFGVLSPEKMRAMSLCEVVTDELYENNQPKNGGLRDPYFGVSSRRGICPVCQKTWSDCSGHFGHFELPCPCFHVGWMYEVLQWLRKTCVHCGHVSNFKVNKKKCTQCNGLPHRYFKKNSTTICVETPAGGIHTLMAPEAREILSKIKSTDSNFHPSSLVLTVLPIPPNCVRPSPTLDGEEVRGEDDITRRLLYVIRIAKAYKKSLEENSIVRSHAAERLQDALHMYIDQARMSTKVKNSQKSISERLRGKTGRLRGTLMGKRCNFTARTVITGDAMLDMRDVGVPKQVAETLTIVEHVNRLNFKQIKQMIRDQDTRIKYVIRKDGTRLDLKTTRGQVDLQVGWSIERQLKDGDLVLFNRQPSLHRMSIMCHRVKIMSQGKTFRLNLSCTTPYNADFDGDEMNLHVLQTHESRADALELMSVAKNIITPQSNRPVMGIVQDSLLSCYLMTQPGVLLDKSEMCMMAMWIEDFEMPTPAQAGRWTGLQCMSMLFPKDFVWKDTIVNGRVLKGPIGKKALGRSHGSIIHRLYNDYGPDRTCRFINELQRINHIWLSGQGFSIGIGDMRIGKDTATAVRQACANVDERATTLRKEHGDEAESKINRMLNQTRDSMGLIAKNAMHPDNSLGRMVSSGSKGSMVNILQIMACVGQQNCQGKRIQPTLGHRTLPMFKPYDDSPRARGFVKHSYIDGLTPDEYWNHTVGGREGLVDTAVKTSATGYIQRRLVKSLESIHVANDTSVRDSQNRIIQFLYGEDGIDGMCHEMVNCPFDELTEPPVDKDWPELTDAWHEYKYFTQCQMGDKWAVPIPCERLLKKHASTPVATPDETRTVISPLLKLIESNQLYYTYALSTLTKHTCNRQSLQRVVDILTKKWHHSIVAPGEMVGTIAAQSIGEPTTQVSPISPMTTSFIIH